MRRAIIVRWNWSNDRVVDGAWWHITEGCNTCNSNKHKQGSISKNFMMQTKNMDVIYFHQSFNSISLTYKYTMCVI